MIGFARPALLPFALLAALPAIIHIISRVRLRRLEFPSLRLLENVRRERIAWTRFRDILLLVMRTLAILALMLALARPFVRPAAALISQPDIVVLLDDSWSMQYSGVWTRACSLTRNVVLSAPPDGRIVLRLASAPETPVEVLTRHVAARVLDTLKPSYRAARVVDALPAACRAAESLSAALVIATDLQHRSLAGNWSAARALKPFVLDVGGERPGNLGITDLDLVTPITLRDRPVDVRVSVTNHSPDRAIATVQLEVEDRSEQTVVELAPGETRRVPFSVRFARPGPAAVEARVLTDSLAPDNRRWVATEVRDSLDVLVVSSPRSSPDHVLAALAADPVGALRVEAMTQAQLAGRDLRGRDAVVVLDALSLKAADWTRLLFALGRGTGLVLMAPPPAPAGAALAGFARPTGTTNPGGYISIADADSLHPLLAGIDPALWRALRFYSFTRLAPDSSLVIARFIDGSPFLLEAAGGRVVIWAVGPDPSQSDLTRKAAFVPLLVSSLERVAIGGRTLSARPGDTLRFPAGEGGAAMLRTPDGRVRLEPVVHAGTFVYEYAGTHAPGPCRLELESSGRLLGLAVVNIEWEEGDLARLGSDALARYGARVSRSVATGRDITQLLLIIVAAAFAVELLLLL